jgi:hypothetical protein
MEDSGGMRSPTGRSRSNSRFGAMAAVALVEANAGSPQAISRMPPGSFTGYSVNEAKVVLPRTAKENEICKPGEPPKKKRHKQPTQQTQLDMLSKIKKLATFDDDQEHEFFADMYKFRGKYAMTIDNNEEADQGQGDEMKNKYKVQYSDPHARVLLPTQLGVWDAVVALLVVVQLVFLPYILAFEPDLGEGFEMVDLTVDLIFVIDIFIQFSTAYQLDLTTFDVNALRNTLRTGFSKTIILTSRDRDVKLKLYETRRKYIVENYFEGWFIIDVMAILPLVIKGVVYLFFPGTNTGAVESLNLVKTLRAPRLLRLAKVARIFKALSGNQNMNRFLLYSKYTSGFRLVGMFFIILLVNHFLACAWFAVAHVNILEHQDPDDTSTPYVAALFDSVHLMVGERKDIYTNAEKIFVFFTIIFMAIFVAIMFGEVAMIVSSFNNNSTKYRRKMTELYEAMDTMALPMTLQERVMQFYDFIWNKHHSLNGKTAMHEFMSELSPNLAKELQMFTYKEMLVNVTFFREFTADVIHMLVQSLDTRIFMPKDHVITVGSCGSEMFFIEYGRCEVFLNHSHVRTLNKNDYFGEIALVTDVRRTASIQASTFAQLVILSRLNFEYCVEELIPEGRKKVLDKILMTFNRQGVLQQCSEPDALYEKSIEEGEEGSKSKKGH